MPLPKIVHRCLLAAAAVFVATLVLAPGLAALPFTPPKCPSYCQEGVFSGSCAPGIAVGCECTILGEGAGACS